MIYTRVLIKIFNIFYHYT